MTHQLDVELSPEWETFRDKIESSLKPFIEILPQQNEDLTWWQSQFGGLPYLPKGSEYPKDAQGNPLFLLAQINFEEVPCLAGFPQTGILQFYIADNGLYGADFDNPTQQEGFRVVYFPAISQSEEDLVTDFSFLPEPEYLPLSGCRCSLQFEKKMAPVGLSDYQFCELFGEEFFENFASKKLDIFEEYVKNFPEDGHRMGGYAYFTQEDPRPQIVEGEKYILLLQIDTDNAVDILWGDSGVGNFFIKEADFEKLDFSGVLYNWDCH
ncbi:MAG: DUF1963 domain-containing protein [Candidatus Parabeggiatoa sp. nov. 2]|nr:MAG: DUF1963 domain-containing protein [Gammaproteobacteria bacterium]